jgi:hypothetical protein
MPNLSLLGHLAGIFTGTVQFWGGLDIILVSDSYLQEMEKWNCLRFLTGQQSFVATPVSSLDASPRDPAAFRRALGSGIQTLVTFVRNILETLLVCIVGRGRDANDNIQLGWWPSSAGRRGDAVADFDEEDDWVGLPPMSSGPVVDRDTVSGIV